MGKKRKALNLTDEQLEELAEITTDDILQAQQAVKKYASKGASNLTLAEEEEEPPNG